MRPITTRFLPICNVPPRRIPGSRAIRADARRFHHRRRRGMQSGAVSSLSPNGSAAAHWFIASAMDSSTRFTTNSCVARTLRRCLGCAVVAVAGREGANRRICAGQIEEAERRGVHSAVGADGRHERDGRGVTRLARIGRRGRQILWTSDQVP